MRHPFTRAVALALTLLTLTSLLAGCKGNPKSVTAEASQMNDAAYTIGVPSGASAVSAVESVLPKAKKQYYNSLSDAYLAVQLGKVDAFAFDRYLLGFSIANGLTGVKVLPGNVGAPDDVAIGISGNSDIPDLQQKINDCLAQLKADGTLDDMFRRWVMNADDTMPDVPKPEHPGMTLKVGTSGVVQPFSYYKGNELTGYDLELAERLALFLNANLIIKVYDYGGFAAAAEAGSIDCVLANLNATPERRETLDFSTPLYQAQTALLVKDDSPTAAVSNISPDTARYGVTSIVAQDYLSQKYPNATFSMFPASADAMLALQSGKLNYVMTSRATAGYMIKQDDTLKIAEDSLVNEACYIAVSKQQPGLRDNVDAVLSKFKENGTLNELTGRWTLDGPDYYRIKEIVPAAGTNGVLKVAFSPDVPPICFMQDGKPVGINIELIQLIAKELDMTVEFFSMDFDALLPAIQSGKVDLAISDINATDERRRLVDFTQSYFDNPQVLVSWRNTVTDSEVPQYTAISQLSGKVVSCLTGSIADILLSNAIRNLTFSYFSTHTDELAALQNGKVDAVPLDEPLARLAVARNSDLAMLPEQVVADYYGIALQKGSPLTDQVNAAIAQLRADGTLEQMKEKWIGSDESVKTLPQLDYPGANGTLRVAHEIAAEPMAYIGGEGVSVGYALELMLRIGQILDRKLEFTGMDFSGLIPMLQSGKADAAVGSMSITDERKKMVDMSESYYDGGIYFVVRKVGVGQSAVTTQPQTSFWDGLKASFTRTFLTEDRWKLVLDGLEITVFISICSGILGSLMGFGICMLRRSKKRIAAFTAAGFIRLIQGTPIVVLLMILYYIVLGKVDVPAVLVAIFGFAVNFGVYVSEMMRTGIDAVDSGQIEAAHALGFTRTKAFWKITFPQAARHFLPIFKGEFISMVKMTSVVGYIAIQDLTKVSDIIRSRTLEAFFPLISTAIIYFLVANILTMLLSRLEVSLDPKHRKRTVKGVVMK